MIDLTITTTEPGRLLAVVKKLRPATDITILATILNAVTLEPCEINFVLDGEPVSIKIVAPPVTP